MTPHDFIAKWRNGGDERRDWHSFFDDLCRLVGHPTPREADPNHTWFTYERGAAKADGGAGWADAWKKGYFGWEAKGTGKDLDRAYVQLKMYADALENPPLLVVTDLQTIVVHTNFTNAIKREYRFTIEQLAEFDTRRILEAVFKHPETLRPGVTRTGLTQDAAEKFTTLAKALRDRGHDPHPVAHFLNRLLFCMFAEDIGLLPARLFTELVENAQGDPALFEQWSADLFRAMRSGGSLAFKRIEWFNGGLFDDDTSLRLDSEELKILLAACRLDWSEIEPSIFGTLFERGLDPSKRSQLGAHYTDPATIMKIVTPAVIAPLWAEWEAEKAKLAALMKKADIFGKAGDTAEARAEWMKGKATRTKAHNEASARLSAFLERLRAFTVLDPACGSGNFLFMALRALKDVEQRVMLDAETLGLPRQTPRIGPANVRGIELNGYAAELARITVWIGEIQWMVQNGYGANRNPILQPLDQIENRDALLTSTGRSATWPHADVVIGNPPFLGSRKMKPELGKDYVDALRKAYKKIVPNGADLVCFWFAKAWQLMEAGHVARAGLVATNSITGGSSRRVLDPIAKAGMFSDVWRDEPWIVDGAAVRVSIIVFDKNTKIHRVDGQIVEQVTSDLRAATHDGGFDPSLVRKIPENLRVSFQGVVLRSNVKKKEAQRLGLPDASFTVTGAEGRRALLSAGNPNGRPNSDVVLPTINGDDITGRPTARFIIDFVDRKLPDAAMYEVPFRLIEPIRQHRAAMVQPEAVATWWLHWRSRPDMRRALAGKSRFIATSAVSKHRLWVWVPALVLPDHAIIVIARDDDTMFGIVHSRLHEVWSERMGTRLGVGNDPRYTPTTCFETFPFPEGLTPNIVAADYAGDSRAERIAAAARALVEARDRWLNPPDWVERVPEVVAGYPDRIVPRPGHEAELKKRTLTNLYNARPAWLEQLHGEIDAAVADAYGWPWPLADEEILRRLFELNEIRAGRV